MARVLVFHSLEFLEEADRSHRRVPRLDRQACAFLIGRHLLLLAVADLEQSEGNLGQCAYILKMPLARISFELHAFGAVVLVHMFDLVAKHRGELVFGVHEVKQAASDKNMSSGQGEGVHQIRIRQVVELKRQLAMRKWKDLAPDALDVTFNLNVFG